MEPTDRHQANMHEDRLHGIDAKVGEQPDSNEGHMSIHHISLEQRLEQVNERLASLQMAVRTAVADVQYAKQRAEADLAHAYKFGIEGFAKALLPFKDALETALSVETNDVNALKAGLELSLKLLHMSLEKHGLVEICPPLGPDSTRGSTGQ